MGRNIDIHVPVGLSLVACCAFPYEMMSPTFRIIFQIFVQLFVFIGALTISLTKISEIRRSERTSEAHFLALLGLLARILKKTAMFRAAGQHVA